MNEEFNLDNFKKDFQKTPIKNKKDQQKIEKMLHKNSIDNAKYILIISIVEFFIGLLFLSYDITLGNRVTQQDVGYTFSQDFMDNINSFALGWRVAYIVFLLVAAAFIITFYRLYKSLKLDDTIKKFTKDILKFRKTANIFIIYNVIVFILFWIVITIFLGNQFKIILDETGSSNYQNIVYIYIFSFAALSILLVLMFIYYRYFWGYFLKRLKENQQVLEEME